MDLGLKDRVAIVAASSQGIGKATALAFAAEGCKLAICARNGDALRCVAEQIESQYGTEVLAQVCDVTDPQAIKSFVAAVGDRFGHIDICVTNAGGPPAKQFLEDRHRSLAQGLRSQPAERHQLCPRGDPLDAEAEMGQDHHRDLPLHPAAAA